MRSFFFSREGHQRDDAQVVHGLRGLAHLHRQLVHAGIARGAGSSSDTTSSPLLALVVRGSLSPRRASPCGRAERPGRETPPAACRSRRAAGSGTGPRGRAPCACADRAATSPPRGPGSAAPAPPARPGLVGPHRRRGPGAHHGQHHQPRDPVEYPLLPRRQAGAQPAGTARGGSLHPSPSIVPSPGPRTQGVGRAWRPCR